MMAFKDRSTQVIELPSAAFTFIALSIGLPLIMASSIDHSGTTVWAAHPIRPTEFPRNRKAFGVIYQLLNLDHH
jgi:hypothetical protein